MLIAISGSTGLLGSELKNKLTKLGNTIVEYNRPLDISSKENQSTFFNKHKNLDLFINCAAYTDVPGAEDNKISSYVINAAALNNLVINCKKHEAHLIHFSTDFVFNGRNNKPYIEKDEVDPINYYGWSKLEGEQNIVFFGMACGWHDYTIFRLQWIYGNNTKNFFQKILHAAEGKKEIKLVDDEFGSPCSAKFISNTISDILDKGLFEFKGGTYHLTHDNSCSRFDCGKRFLNSLGYNSISRINNLPEGKVSRPKYGVLNNSKLVKVLEKKLGTWEEDLDLYITEIKNAM